MKNNSEGLAIFTTNISQTLTINLLTLKLSIKTPVIKGCYKQRIDLTLSLIISN